MTGKLATQWALGNQSKFLLAGEVGYAPNTSDKSALNLGTTEPTKGTAWQTTFNLINFIPNHSIGLVTAKVNAGWLLSPDFRNNNILVEIRYRWNIDKNFKLEARARRRKEIDKLTTSTVKRLDKDSYIRLTWKF